jgi:tetratricopeptide (TPR) repeat protein
MEHDQLAWGFVENRPFLRLYHSYGWILMKRGEEEKALQVFENLLSLNPHDNQGARTFAVSCHFALHQPEGVLSLCKEYPDDALEALVYGRGLALFQLGKFKLAAKAMDLGIKYFPLIAAEIVNRKHRKAKADDQYVTPGSQQQADLYWQEQGRYWTETWGAIEHLRNRMAFQK